MCRLRSRPLSCCRPAQPAAGPQLATWQQHTGTRRGMCCSWQHRSSWGSCWCLGTLT
jgi:hypothetical protein